jgi:hypothetical protein
MTTSGQNWTTPMGTEMTGSCKLCMYVCIYVWMDGCMCMIMCDGSKNDGILKTLYVCMYVCICLCIYMFMYIYVCVCTYIHAYILCSRGRKQAKIFGDYGPAHGTYVCIYVCLMAYMYVFI